MKAKITLLTMFSPVYLFAQQLPDKVVFEYDNAGNQIYRGIVIDMTPTIQSIANTEDDTQTKSDALGYDESKLKYYPNPVQNVLYVEWDRMHKEVQSISLYTANHQVIKQIGNLVFENQTQLNFNQLPKGSYFMVVLYQDGTKENITIIKR
ncbi:T9SS type A sorting domain-containing protein [Myroides odoratus]|uniref:T9SS type A sorting domain-containing protein n=1 Tax=Myroides odoratus TaxID=256 RepID=UPI0033427A80